jgi:hypothetical protein
MSETTSHSARFTRAALAEAERLLRRRNRAVAEAAKVEHQLEAARARLAAIEERLAEVRRITGGTALTEAKASTEARASKEGGSPVRGAKIREIAVRVLLASPEAEGPVHYRRWLELVEEAGYSVHGKRPEAVFLGQLVRSPVVRQTSRAGYYELDHRAPERLRERLRALEAERLEASTTSSSPDALAQDIERQEELTKEIRLVQRELREAMSALGENGQVIRIAA